MGYKSFTCCVSLIEIGSTTHTNLLSEREVVCAEKNMMSEHGVMYTQESTLLLTNDELQQMKRKMEHYQVVLHLSDGVICWGDKEHPVHATYQYGLNGAQILLSRQAIKSMFEKKV